MLLPPNLEPVLSHPNGPSEDFSKHRQFFSLEETLGPGVKMLFFLHFSPLANKTIHQEVSKPS